MMNHHTPQRLPLHIEISEMLAREIQAGILLEGSKLAPERLMAKNLGVSVGTLRKALLDLEKKGLLERIHGSGNYVRRTDISEHMKANTVYGFFRLELIKGGGLPTAQVLSVNRLNKPNNIGNIGSNRKGYRIRRLRSLNKVPAAIEEIWLDVDRCNAISKDDLSDSMYLFYKEKLGFWITRADDFVSAAAPPSWKPDDFSSSATNKRNPKTWGYVERLSYDQDTVCAEFSKTWFNPATVRFVARWK